MKDLINSFKENIVILFLLTVSSICLIFILYNMYALPEFANLKLNEKGDFIAGILSPLGFIWLIYGYIQQGQELKLNIEALTLQAEELSNSVEQQKELVKATREELDIIKRQSDTQYRKELVQRQPFFHFIDKAVMRRISENVLTSGLKDSDYKILVILLTFNNSREIAREVRISANIQGLSQTWVKLIDQLPKGSTDDIKVVLKYPDCFIGGALTGEIVFDYLDELDEKHYQTYKMEILKINDNGQFHKQISLSDKSY